MKKFIIFLIIAGTFTSCMTTVSTVGRCKYYYRPSLKNAKWRHL